MCAHMMSGQVYSAFPGMPLMLLSILLITLEIRTSRRALQYQVERVVRLAAEPDKVSVTDSTPRGTVHARAGQQP